MSVTLAYDDDCGFCRRAVARWRRVTGDRVEYLPSSEARTRFAQVPAERFDHAVVLIDGEGGHCFGAEAVFRALAETPRQRWKLWCYERVPGIAPLSEAVYRFIAANRKPISKVTRFASGADPEPSSYAIARWTFLRLLGVIYLVAFLSLLSQVDGLIGSGGLLPAADFMDWAGEQFPTQRVRQLPTLCWLGVGDGTLHWMCGLGVAMSLALVAGLAPIPMLAGLWMVYLSLTVVGQAFLSFQWDTLLLETGFLAMFVAPLQLLPRMRRQRQVPRLGRWLLWVLLFKLMFLSGITKWLSGDPTWRDGSAMEVHYQTQPLPSWLGWYAHQLPAWTQHFSVVVMFVIEVALPFLIFAPRRLRHAAAAGLLGLQLLIAATGSYGFFNLLTLALCVLLLDDTLLRRLLPMRAGQWWGERAVTPLPLSVHVPAVIAATVLFTATGLVTLREMVRSQRRDTLPAAVTWVLDTADRWILYQGGYWLLARTDPFRTINGYGLFRVMTTERPEIVVEGSVDGLVWEAYVFRWKPGPLDRRPRFATPHMPRLDWQMWFAALSPQRNAYWLAALAGHLLEGTPQVVDLLESTPFDGRTPNEIRFVLYRYEFTDLETRRATGQWWQREWLGPLGPPIRKRVGLGVSPSSPAG